MTNVVSVKPSDGWKAICTNVGGMFSATSPCLYTRSVSPPTTNYGHRLDGGDNTPFILKENETLYVKSSNDISVIYSSVGVGYFQEWMRLNHLGQKATAVQPYIEANCKNGSQWGFSSYDPALAANASRFLILKTGAKPISLKSRTYIFDGLGIRVNVRRNAVFTGGINVTSMVYNFSDRNPDNLLCELHSVTAGDISNNGTLWIPDRHFIGDSQTGSNLHTVANPDLTGLELWFNENTTYLIETTSIDPSDSQRLVQFGTFYQGFPDLP